MNIEKITKLTTQDMMAVNIAILEQLHSDVTLINQLGYYIISSGGKRIRPIIALLAARALNYTGHKHVTIAALIELIHTATLLHDDVVDKSEMRRGHATANSIFGNSASILVGDFIYTRAFQMMTTLESMRVLALISNAVNVIAEGEVLQLMNVHNPDITEASYMQIIYRKTARLFEVAVQSSAILSNANQEEEKALQDYGRHLGIAFQLTDDLLDYSTSSSSILGKNTGHDLNEGKATLPLLHAMQNGNKKQRSIIRDVISKGNKKHLMEHVLKTIQECASLQYTNHRAEEEAKKAIIALQILPQSSYRDALERLAYLAVQRDF